MQRLLHRNNCRPFIFGMAESFFAPLYFLAIGPRHGRKEAVVGMEGNAPRDPSSLSPSSSTFQFPQEGEGIPPSLSFPPILPHFLANDSNFPPSPPLHAV